MRTSTIPAPAMIGRMKDEQLLQLWEMTAAMEYSQKLADVRGWLMDEISVRHPEEFDAWLDSDADDMKLREYIKK